MDWNPLLMPVEDPLLDLLAEMCKELNGHNRRLQHLESAPPKEDGAPRSFAHTTGPAMKPLRSGTVSHREIGGPILRAIMEGSKSTKYTLPELVEFSEDSTTLQLTLKWPTQSG